jgi:hypothetical protein
MAHCNWSTDKSVSSIMCNLHDRVPRFTFRLSLYDSQLVLLVFLKVTWFVL